MDSPLFSSSLLYNETGFLSIFLRKNPFFLFSCQLFLFFYIFLFSLLTKGKERAIMRNVFHPMKFLGKSPRGVPKEPYSQESARIGPKAEESLEKLTYV